MTIPRQTLAATEFQLYLDVFVDGLMATRRVGLPAWLAWNMILKAVRAAEPGLRDEAPGYCDCDDDEDRPRARDEDGEDQL